MFHAVTDFGGLGIVETVKGADEVTGDAADTLEVRATIILTPSTLGADVINDAAVAADGVAVERVVHRTVTNAMLCHVADDLLEGFRVIGHLAVELNVGDMATVGEGMIGGLQLNFAEGADGIVDGDVEGVGVVFAIGDFGDGTKALAIHPNESSGKSFGRCGDEREVEAGFGGATVGIVAHMADDFEAEALRFLAFTVMFADETF